jgi:hypothetical protein
VEMGRVARENDSGAGRIGFQLARVELIAQPDIKDTGNNGIDSILRVLVRHQFLAVRHFDPDGVRAGLRGLTDDDGEPDGRWERRERFPINILRQDGFEHFLSGLVSTDSALLSRLCAAGFLRHTNLLGAGNVSHKVEQNLEGLGLRGSKVAPPTAARWRRRAETAGIQVLRLRSFST